MPRLLFAGAAGRFSLQLLDCGFSLVLGQLLLKTLCGFLEAGIAVELFGAAWYQSCPQKQHESYKPQHRPSLEPI